jgi:hypothetical protein
MHDEIPIVYDDRREAASREPRSWAPNGLRHRLSSLGWLIISGTQTHSGTSRKTTL